jgi:hypothetical protein
MNDTLFTTLSKEQKIDFFIQCQKLLIAHHPKSEFIFTEKNLKSRLEHVKDLSIKYKGFCHFNENICLLYNKIKINNINEPIQALKENMYQPPKDDFNAMAIDFVVFRKLEDCLRFCRDNYDDRIKYIMFIKNNKPKIYETKKFVSNILNIPIASR